MSDEQDPHDRDWQLAKTAGYQEAIAMLDKKYADRCARAELRVAKLEEQLRNLGVEPAK